MSTESIGRWSRRDWTWLLAGLTIVYALFHGAASALGSDRGQAGLAVAALVVTATLAVERLWTGRSGAAAMRALGFGPPRIAGLAASAVVCLLLLLVVPVFASRTGAVAALVPGAVWLLPGLFAQAGLAEELLFRGFLFGHLHEGRTFWRAAALAMPPFVAVHLVLFATMPWPIAVAALLLSVFVSFPLARLFVLGGGTIWPPALVHAVIQGTVKVVAITGAEPAAALPLVWMAASASVPWLAFLVPIRAAADPRSTPTPARSPRHPA